MANEIQCQSQIELVWLRLCTFHPTPESIPINHWIDLEGVGCQKLWQWSLFHPGSWCQYQLLSFGKTWNIYDQIKVIIASDFLFAFLLLSSWETSQCQCGKNNKHWLIQRGGTTILLLESPCSSVGDKKKRRHEWLGRRTIQCVLATAPTDVLTAGAASQHR